jgi:hypothetical protein
MTIGIVDVACFSAGNAGPRATITSTCAATSSSDSAGKRSGLPSLDRGTVTKCSP